MPSQMLSSFASAVGQGSNHDMTYVGKSEGRGNGDWARKENKPVVNGTLTLRRPPTKPLAHNSAQGDSQVQIQSESLGSQQSIFDQSCDFRYSKKDLLDIYKRQRQPLVSDAGNVSHLFADGWVPGEFQGSSGKAGWGKTNDGKDCYTPDICWDFLGVIRPVGLEEMSEEEKKLFKADINSPFKPPSQNLKDSTVNGRKSSFSHGQSPNNFNHLSPVSSRPSARRQQTNDSLTNMVSPSGVNRFSRDEQSPSYSRKQDEKENVAEHSDENKIPLSQGASARSNVGSIPNVIQLSSWIGPSNTTHSPMGAFGNFSLPNTSSSITGEKRLTNLKTESRFFQSTSKDSTEVIANPTDKSWRLRQRTDTDPFAEETPSEINAMKVDDSDQLNRRFDSLDLSNHENTSDFGTVKTPDLRNGLNSEQSHHTPEANDNGNERAEPPSPSDTNPYRSPSDLTEDRKRIDTEVYNTETHISEQAHDINGPIENGMNTHGTTPRGFPNTSYDGMNDHCQNSNSMRSRVIPQLSTLPSLGTIGNLGGWSAASGSPIGVTDRDNRTGFSSTFGTSLFGSMGEIQSSGHSNLTGMFGTASSIPGSATARGSKLGSLFPASLQAQMQTIETDSPAENEARQGVALNTMTRNSFTSSRDTDSQIRNGRHGCDDPFSPAENSRSIVNIPTPDNSRIPRAPSFSNSTQQSHQTTHPPSDSVPNQQLPTTQQRIMVMPDRMRWLYLDPQAQVQGPFSGLEMHEWYIASFFTPDLSVKKLEDVDFEPLGQLIRRIGNSREPFLVPQIGIPHGHPSTPAGAAFTPPAAGHGPGLAQTGVVHPPLANSFPSYGTTLTAEQQNNLERRKQEEQYLMARQREFLAQQQINIKQMQMSGIPSVHHSSLHNLQNLQPFGGISSPVSIPPQPHLTSGPGFFDGLARQISTTAVPGEFYSEEDLSRLTIRERHGQQTSTHFVQPDIQSQAYKIDDIEYTARLQEFEKLREISEIREHSKPNIISQQYKESTSFTQKPQQLQYEEQVIPLQVDESESQIHDSIPTTQRTQKDAPKKQLQPSFCPKESPWMKVNSSLPMPFPPPQPKSSIPSTASQRDRFKTSETLNFEMKVLPQTADTTTSYSIAPWAKEPSQASKPPLKETAEAEAKKAAVVRRTSNEQEIRSNITQKSAVSPPGLPTSATWASSTSPRPAPIKSAWANSITKGHILSNKQKTLADIQKEEETRKQKLANAVASQSLIGSNGNKRYADLASKSIPNTDSTGGPAWVTVGAGGKVKAPFGPTPSAQVPTTHSSSAHIVTLPTRTNPKPVTSTAQNNTVSTIKNVNLARDELTKWARVTLKKNLNPDINVNDFIAMLNTFPSEESIIADSIYSQSQTMNGRDFALEYIRRRNNAEKGIIEPVSNGSNSALSTAGDKSGGWNEVAKKGPPKEEPIAGFKFVPSKKKSKK